MSIFVILLAFLAYYFSIGYTTAFLDNIGNQNDKNDYETSHDIHL